MDEIIIKENKIKSIGMVVLGAVMTFAGVFVLINGTTQRDWIFVIVGIVGTIFFGACEAYIIKRGLKPKPLLVIGKDGITDMSTASSVGFIAWDEIKSVSERRVFTQKFIGITVYDLDKLMNRISPLKQRAIKTNLKLDYPPVAISLNTADERFDKVLSIIQERLNGHILGNK